MNCLRCFFTLALVIVFARGAFGDGELGGRATWRIPTGADVRIVLSDFLKDIKAPAEAQNRATQLAAADPPLTGTALLEEVVEIVALAQPSAAESLKFCRSNNPTSSLPKFAVLQDESVAVFVRNNLRLLYGRWLAHHGFYDESTELLAALKPAEVVDPATLLFYQAAGHHRLLDKEKCLPLLAKLMENESKLPRRYVDLARLMQADLAPLKPDTLNEVARIMDDIERRLGHGRAGKKVRDQEDEVVRKLEKMIEEMEKKRQQMQQASSGNGGGSQPSAPMQDSQGGSGKGPGNVDPKKIAEKGGWGNLPPKEREESLQQIGKDLPAHYRDVIEEYFRKLARDGVE